MAKKGERLLWLLLVEEMAKFSNIMSIDSELHDFLVEVDEYPKSYHMNQRSSLERSC